MDKFLSCDWGTSSFRLRLVEVSEMAIVAEEDSDEGIHAAHTTWRDADQGASTKGRLGFYLAIIRKHIERMEAKEGVSLKGVPVVLSGMASSSLGMMELPYSPLPFATKGADLLSKFFDPQEGFNHPLLLISGVKSKNDVMRGEEIQLIGVGSDLQAMSGLKRCIFPGTHSKHIWVEGQQVLRFKTFMTGEFFDLLSCKSILRSNVEKKMPMRIKSFTAGVIASTKANLLHNAFLVRTNQLLDKLTKEENYYYLSGLIIGTELQDIRNDDIICLCSEAGLRPLYETALKVLRPGKAFHSFPDKCVEEAVIRGQYYIYKNLTHKYERR